MKEERENCKHQPAVEGGANPCPHCPPIPTQAPMGKVVAVGFGAAYLTRDDETIVDGEQGYRFHGRDQKPEKLTEWFTFGDAEELAAADPDHDWQITLHGPLHGETYQRQGPSQWVLIERNEGFA